MRKLYFLFLFIFISLCSFAQSVLNPNDTIVTYNSSKPPTEPAYGQVGKWVRTPAMWWNTSEWKCYIYKGCAFRLHFPKTYNPTANDGKKYPMIVFFHGLGETGGIYDNERQLQNSAQTFQNTINNGTYDGYALFMQSQGFWGTGQYQYITEIIDYMINNNKLDPFQVTDNGLSAGGQGCWEMLINQPTYISASTPVSNCSIYYKDTATTNVVRFTPLWNFQGGLDGSPAPSTGQQVRDGMLAAGANFSYTEFPDLGHGCWEAAYALPDYWPFQLRAYSSNPWTLYGRTKFCPGDTINVTIGLARGFDAYQWRFNGNVISGATSNTIQATQAGSYDARVQRKGIWSDWSRTPVQIIVQASTPTLPIQTTGLMSQVIPAADGKTSVTLQVSGNNNYIGYKWKKVGSDSIISTQSTYTATQPGYYAVAATQLYSCTSLFSAPFKVIDAKGPNAPVAVKGLLANVLSNTQVQLSWNLATQQANTATAFEVYRGTTSGKYNYAGKIAYPSTVYIDSNLTPKVKYFYTMRAVDSTGAAPLSNEAFASTYSDTTAPSIPGSLILTGTTSSTISFSWSASTDNVAVDRYNVYVNGTLTNVTKQTSFTVNSLNANQTYAIYVKAVDASGNISGQSNQLSATAVAGGLNYKVYQGSWGALPNFTTLTPVQTGVSANTDISVTSLTTNFGIVWQGYITIPVAGTYTFATNSDDGSAIWFNSLTATGTPTVNNDGAHAPQTASSAALTLQPGTYPICIEYFQAGGGLNMTTSWSSVQLFGDNTLRAIDKKYFTTASPVSVASATAAAGSLNYSYYPTTTSWSKLPDFTTLTPTAVGTSTNTDISIAKDALYGIVWKGYINIPVAGTYTFYTNSDDGSALWFNSLTPTGTPTVNNDGSHAPQNANSVGLYLQPGVYPICIEYYQSGGGSAMTTLFTCQELFGNLNGNPITNYLVPAPTTGTNTLQYSYYPTTTQWTKLPDFTTLKPTAVGTSTNTDLNIAKDAMYGIVWKGYMKIPVAGTYTFYTNSDDGSALWFNSLTATGTPTVNNDGNHWAQNANSVGLVLQPGIYPICIEYYQAGGDKTMTTLFTCQELFGNLNGNYITNYLVPAPVASTTMPASGLKYSYYPTTTSWSKLPDFTKLTPAATGTSANTDISIAKDALYGIVWQGYLNVPVAGTYTFYTNSDDGSALWFNSLTATGTPTVNNDGSHAPQNANSVALSLQPGQYPICIEYYQSGGGSAMTTLWTCQQLYGNLNGNSLAPYFGTFTSGITMPGVATGTATAYNKINLSWIDNSNNETGFEIYRSTSATGTYNIAGTVVANATAFADSTASASTTYYYKIQAINQKGNSGLTNASAGITTPALPAALANPPAFPVNAVSASKISMTWTAVASAASYQLSRSTDNSNYININTVSGSTTSYFDSALNANTKYWYRIKTVNSAGVVGNYSIGWATTLNTAPVITKLNSITVPYGLTSTIALNATDSDGDVLTYSSLNLPSFATIQTTANNASLVLNPAQSNIGVYNNIKVFVNDVYGGKDSTVFTLTVNSNYAPKIDSVTNYTLSENDVLNISLNATDANSGDVLTWSAANMPNAYTLTSSVNGKATLSLKPNYLAAGTYNASVSVSDGNGGSDTRKFIITVNDANPNINIYARFQNVDTIGKPWNSITGVTTNNLVDAAGKTTTVGLALQTSAFNTFNGGASTGNNSGVYPDAVLLDYYYFGIFGAPETVDTKITGLDTSRTYNLTFFANSTYAGVADNGSTIYTVGSQSVSLPVQANTKNTVAINGIKPATDGTITYNMSKAANAAVGYINSLVINSIFDDGSVAAAPTSLTAQVVTKGVQLSWTDVAYNETGYYVYRALTSTGTYKLLAQTVADAISFTDTTTGGTTQYFYKIAAFNTRGVSAYSNVVSITTPNRAPQLIAISDIAIKYNQTASVTVTATDDSTDRVRLTASGLPSFATFADNGNGTGKITVTPTANNIGAYAVIITATDNANATTTGSFNILISDPNISSTYLSFSDGAKAVPKPWNMLAGYPAPGTSFSNINDDSNVPTGMTVTFKNGFSGAVQSGMQPVEGSGIYPNVVMRTAEFEQGTQKDTIQVSGLSTSKKYNFVFFNSHDDGLQGNTTFTIGSTTVTLNATDNINKTVQINGVTATNGVVYVVVQKVAGSDYAFISTMIIQSYASTYTALSPTNLLTTAVTRNSIGLQWEDRAYSETGYQIWRAADSTGSYSLLTTVGANVTSYTDANLPANKTYNYAVRAVLSSSAYSAFSNQVKASTYAYNVYLNYTYSSNASLPWNNIDALPSIGLTANNFFDEKGITTSTGMVLTSGWGGLYTAGMTTSNNSGVVPDAVMADGYGLFQGQVATVQITGLNLGMKYDFTFFGSSQAYGDVNTAYSINGVKGILNTSLNTNGTILIAGVTPDQNGNVTLTISLPTTTSQFGLLNGLIIGAYTPSASSVVPTLPATQSLQSGSATSVIAKESKPVNTGGELKAYPNPFHDYFMLDVPSATKGKIQVVMYDITGKPVYANNTLGTVQEGNNTFRIVSNTNLSAGIYTVIVINTDSKTTKTIRLVKQ